MALKTLTELKALVSSVWTTNASGDITGEASRGAFNDADNLLESLFVKATDSLSDISGDLVNLGTAPDGEAVFAGGITGKRIKAGSNITLTPTANSLEISAPVAGSGATVRLDTQSVSGETELEFTGIDPSTYAGLEIRFYAIAPDTSNREFQMILGDSTSYKVLGNYWELTSYNFTGANSASAGNNDTNLTLSTATVGTTSNRKITGKMDITLPDTAGEYVSFNSWLKNNNSIQYQGQECRGLLAEATMDGLDLTRIKFQFNLGTITGKAILWGTKR